MKKWVIQLRKELPTSKKRRENNSTIETKYDEHANKVLMHEAVK